MRIAALALLAAVMVTARAGAATLPESIPDFSLDTSRPGVQTVQSGAWSSAATWQGGVIPTANHVVRILSNHVVTIDNTSAVAYTVAIDGKLAFNPAVDTRLQVTNLMVMAGELGMGTPGVLEVGTVAAPIAAGVTAEIIIANSAIGGSVADPLQFGTGLIVLGKVTMHGTVRTPTFVRVATEPRAGNATLTLSEAVSGWTAGDRLVLPDTRHIKESEVTGSGWINTVNQWEERTVTAISSDRKTVTLNAALQYDHLGARDLNGVLDFLPHVGNLTRNVVIRSENAAGTRGHAIMTHLADVDIRYALFKDLGRTTYLPLNTTTNAIGRYPVHAHHLSGPLPSPANGYQFTLLGNAVDGGSAETKFKWGITVHASHYGNIQDNVVYNYNGAAIATEDGSESFNVFDHNFALRGMGEPNDSVSEARMAMGTEGVGFWFRGTNNFVRNNVAANYQNPTTEAAYGYAFQLRFLGNVAVPNFKGAHDMAGVTPSQFTTRNGNNMPILQFENNEAYGAMQGGFTQWWVSSQDPQPSAGAQESLIQGLKLWNIYNKTVYMYPSQKITFDGLKIRGNFIPNTSRCCGNGVYFADYSSKGIVIRNSDIQGMEEGITAPEAGFGPEANLTIENSYLRNISNLDVPTNGSVNGCWMDPKLVVTINTRFDVPPGRSADHISMVGDVASAPSCLSVPDEMRVYAYNGTASDNFQVYHTSSTILPRPPVGCTPTTRTGIGGLICPIAALSPVPPTATISVSPASMVTGQTAIVSWSTTNATSVTISQGIGTVAASGTRNVTPTATTTYTLTATNANGSTTATATVTITVTKATPVISWETPANIAAGTPLSATQLNASTTVAGTWAYTPPAGTVLAVGAGQVLSVTFTPTDGANYTTASKAVAITIVPLVISSAAASTVTATSATITWTTSAAASSRVDYGGTAASDRVAVDGTLVTAHRLLLTGLIPSTTYHYRITSQNGAGASVSTDDLAFATVAPAKARDGDFDGDGKADLAVFRPSGGNWFVRYSSLGYSLASASQDQWGQPGDVPIGGDFDGDGKLELTVWRPSNGTWYVRYSAQNYNVATAAVFQWGQLGDIPVAGDFDGDGKTELTVFRPSNGTWYICYSSQDYNPFTAAAFQWGVQGDVPVAGDFDGDGHTELTVFRPSNGTWYVRYSLQHYDPFTAAAFQWGVRGDVPVAGDFDGDGQTELTVYRPSVGGWFVNYSSLGYAVGRSSFYQWGASEDVPMTMDFDGDGTTDLAVFRPSTGTWYVRYSSLGYSLLGAAAAQWGASGDTPIK